MDEHGPCIIMYSWFSYYQRWCSIVLSVYQMGHDIQYTFIHWEINPLRLDDKYGLSFRLEVFFILFQMLGTQLDWCFSSRIPRSDDQALFGAQFMALVEGKNYRKPLWLVITHVDFSFTIPLYYTSIASHSSSGCFHSPWTLREGDGERERELKYYLVSTYLSIYTFKKHGITMTMLYHHFYMFLFAWMTSVFVCLSYAPWQYKMAPENGPCTYYKFNGPYLWNRLATDR
jgi:hypothetical protein